MANVFEENEASACRGILEDDVFELSRIGEAADDTDGHLVGLRFIGGRLTELAGGDLNVLLGESVGDVERGEATRGKAGGVKPDAHSVLALAEDDDVAYAGDALEGVLDIDVEIVRDELVGIAVVLREDAGGEDEVAVRLGDGDAGGVDGSGQAALRGGHAVLNVDGGDGEVVARAKGDGNGGCSVVGAGGADIAHALDAVDGSLEGNRDRGLDDLGVGADVVAGDDNLRRCELRIGRDRRAWGNNCPGANTHPTADRADNPAATTHLPPP